MATHPGTLIGTVVYKGGDAVFSKVFAYKGLVWRILNTLTDVLFLSLLFVACSLPLFTLGASLTALYDTVVRCVRYQEEEPYRRFFRTFRESFRTATLSTLLWGAISGAGFFILACLRKIGFTTSSAVAAGAAWYVVLLIPIGSVCWAFPILSRFENSFRALTKTAFRFSLAYLPRTLVLVLLVIEVGSLSLRHLFLLAFTPALLMLLLSLFTEPVFQKLGGGVQKEPEDSHS